MLALAQMSRDSRVETAEAKLGRDHHQTEQQRDRGDVDRAPCVVERHPAGRDQRDRAEQRDAGAIELEAGQLAQDHPEIDEREDGEDDGIHQRRAGSGVRDGTRQADAGAV